MDPSKIHGEYAELATVPFNSKNKWMASVFRKNASSLPIMPKLETRVRTMSSCSVESTADGLSESYYGDCFDFDEENKSVVVVKGRQHKLCLFHVGHL